VESGVLSPSTAELNLLLEWPDRRTRPQWALILAASVSLHIVLFFIGIKIPSLVGTRAPDREVVVHHVPLYLPPPGVMTQREPNKQKPAKQIDLADLAPSRESKASPARRGSVRRFEIPKQTEPKNLAKNLPPQILPQAPPVDIKPNAAAAPGSPGGLPATAPPPAAAPPSPFQDLGDEKAPSNPNPKLAPPKAGVDAAIDGLAKSPNSPQGAISDDVPERSSPGSPGTLAQAPAQHAAVELQSDPNGADFKEYLRTILTIVRANWRKVIPESARMGTLHGKTVIEFIIDRDGSIPKLVTADTSGSEPLDRAAVAGLSMSNPLPPLPATYKGFQVRLAFTFAYNMPTQ
jgi:TonB family protein